MKFVDYFLEEHARCHSAEMTGTSEPMLEDRLVDGLTDDQLRLRPSPGLNSIAWILWHLARSEDAGINVLVAERPQVLTEDGWLQRLNLSQLDMGTGMRDEEVTEVGYRIDIPALHAYHVAVGRRTREVVRDLSNEQVDEFIDPTRLLEVGAFPDSEDGARRVATYWRGRRKRFLLTASHDFQHLGEAMCIRTLVQRL